MNEEFKNIKWQNAADRFADLIVKMVERSNIEEDEHRKPWTPADMAHRPDGLSIEATTQEVKRMNDRERLEAILKVVCDYLPPDGISRKKAMSKIIGLVDPLPEQSESQEPVGAVEYSELEQMKDECDSYRDMMDAFSADNDLLYAILRHAETEMRYAGWDVRQEDNFTRHQLYQRIQEVLKGEEMSDAESQEPVESNDLQGFISDDYSHILVYPKGSYPEGGVDLYTAPLKREWVSLSEKEVQEIFDMDLGVYESIEETMRQLKEKNNG
jgi:hypothetical protein